MRTTPVMLGLLAGCSAALLAPGADTVAFDDWTRTGEAHWRPTAEGIAAGPGGGAGFLVSPGWYADFRLTVEFRVDEGTNSGVFIRCRDRARITPFDCHEINIWDNHPNQDFRTGSIVTKAVPLARVDTLGRDNRLVIEAEGARVTVTVNGVVTAEHADPGLLSGHIALQRAEQGRVEFRNLRIEPLR
ncbi:MAG: DUF1080 domain-containing protein [Woeseiaceae bacterium]|nr:DUF1080 domain-containing protein [Woeseiaceae bacterium]